MDSRVIVEALRPTAREILRAFDGIAARVREEMQQAKVSPDALANMDREVIQRAMQQLDARAVQRTSELHRLKEEPAISRVVVENARKQKVTYYICRGTPPTSTGLLLASQRSPVGRLAALDPGDDVEVERVGSVIVLENAQLRPHEDRGGWDSLNTLFRTLDFDPQTAESLRELLRDAAVTAGEDILSQLEAEFSGPKVMAGARREVLRHMELRDQPVLDRIQDEIFRLPMVTRMLLAGPPGTGKTTTLIRRLGQKLDEQWLAEDEQRLAQRIATETGLEFKRSWLMFTPTTLLKQYVKEAFAREDIAAPDRQIWTWTDYRTDLARNRLGLLRTSTGKSGFVLRPGSAHLSGLPDWRAWFDDFDRWQYQAYTDQLRSAAQLLLLSTNKDVQTIGRSTTDALADPLASPESLGAALANSSSDARELAAAIEEDARLQLRSWTNNQLRNDRDFLDSFADFQARLQSELASNNEADDEEDDNDDETLENDSEQARSNRVQAAARDYQQVLRTLARSRAAGGSVSKSSRTGRTVTWLADRLPPTPELLALGKQIQLQGALRQLAYPGQGLLRGVARRYREYRRVQQQEGRWYAQGVHLGNELDPHELDLVLAVIFRRANALLSSQRIRAKIDQPAWASLKPFLAHLRHQILVDEATDFSALQLAIMAALVHPEARSFFACGDFNQRLTTWGVQSPGEFEWAVPGISQRRVDVPYRQSKKLAQFAERVLEVTGQSTDTQHFEAPNQPEGYSPVLGENLGEDDELAGWLSARIEEVERNVAPGTSIAVLVPSEDWVGKLAEALQQRLSAINLPVQACRDGQSVGVGSAVRVFDVQHIKGLEFEAVFLVGLDALASEHADLFDKFLYVGATRAANCLGLACAGELPQALIPLRRLFVSAWPPT